MAIPGDIKKVHVALFIIFVIAAALRCWPLIEGEVDLQKITPPDSAVYLDLSKNLSEQGSFQRSYPRSSADLLENPWTAEVFRTPGYPILITVIRKVFGENLKLVIIIQIILDLFILYVTYKIGERLGGLWTGALAAGLLAVDPLHLVYANQIMTDIPFVFLFCLIIWQTLSFPAPVSIWSAGLACLLACSLRPVAAGLGPLLVFFAWQRGASRKSILILLFLTLIFPVCWSTRNAALTGKFQISNAMDYNSYLVLGAKVQARVDRQTYASTIQAFTEKFIIRLQEEPEHGWFKIFSEQGGPALTKHPIALVEELGYSLLELMLTGERRNFLKVYGIQNDVPRYSYGEIVRSPSAVLAMLLQFKEPGLLLSAIQIIWNCFLIGFAAVGVRDIWQTDKRNYLVLLLVLTGYFILLSIPVASARMRLPITPMLAVLSAIGLVHMVSRFRRRSYL